jgi:hypothetical protein
MPNIAIPQTITQAPDYSRALYESLINKATANTVAAATVNELLCNAIDGGKSFSQALALAGSDLPALPAPASADMTRLKDWVGLPSPGALIMSATTEFAAEQRRQNQELMWKETEALAASMKDQAQEMRAAAVKQLIMGVVSGAVQIGIGAAQAAMGAAASKNALAKGAEAAQKAGGGQAGEKASSEAFSSAMMKANINIGAVGQIGGGVTKGIDSGALYVGAQMQARAKEMEADQEKMKAVRESIRNLDEAMHALIQKSLAAQNDIQASTNQARTRILA